MTSKIMSTGLVPDSELEDTDIYGNVPLVSYEDNADEEDADVILGAATRDEDDEEEEQPLIEPSFREVLVSPGNLRNDDPAAFAALTEHDGGDELSPGEAARLIDYMRPLSVEEEKLADDPMYNDLTMVDDAASIDDLMRHAKGSNKAMTNFMQDEIYGEETSGEEMADRLDTDRFIPSRLPTVTNQSLVNARKAKYVIIAGLSRTLVDEHAAWLAEQDRKAGIKVRPHDYYLNVSKLWAKDKLKKAALPTSLKDDFSGSVPAFVGAASELLVQTKDKRHRDDSMGWGFNPFSAVKSIAKKSYSLTKRSITDPLKYGYKYGKRGITDPLKYGYRGLKKGAQLAKKGIEAGLSLAQRAALAPIKAIIGRFRGKMVNQRAAYYAKQAGVATPTPAMNAKALAWSKDFVRKNNSQYGGTIASLMGGSDGPGSYNVDLSLSLGDDMGAGIGDIARLIVVGPITIASILLDLLKKAVGMGGGGGQAPANQPDDPSMQDDGSASPDDGSADPGASPDAGDPGTADPGDYPDDGSQGWVQSRGRGRKNSQIRRTVTLEQMTRMSAPARAKIQQALRQGRIRLV